MCEGRAKMRGGEIPEVGLEGCFQGELLAWRAVYWGSPLLCVCFWGLFSERSMTSPFAEELVCFRMYQWRRQWQPTPVLLPGKSHGRRSLVGCSPPGHEESETTERLHFHFSLSFTGERNGNPLQYSCLENPRASLVGCHLWGRTESDTTEAT